MRTLLLGLDAFDPIIFERLSATGRLPNLTKYVESGGYSRFDVSNPPQSEVSWTSIATGLDPGGHGLFDFVHRDPVDYGLSVSLLQTKRGVGGTHFANPFSARTIFDQAVRDGYGATVLWWPGTFPARLGSPVRTIPGLGTPDLHGRWGVGTLFSNEVILDKEDHKTTLETLQPAGKDLFKARLYGPIRKKSKGERVSFNDLKLELIDSRSARLTMGKQCIEIAEGVWSPILETTFDLGRFISIRAMTRVILTQLQPFVKLYVLPLQLHPLHSPWPYGSPKPFIKRTWKDCGPFLTVGWPQDTTGLEEGCIDDRHFLNLCGSIDDSREKVLMYHLQNFKEGIFASVFDTLDRVQHMFLHDRPDIVEEWYERLDGLVGRVEEGLAALGRRDTHLVIVSDHGFAEFRYKVHVNHWLIEHGYLVAEGKEKVNNLKNVDWEQSKCYAIGLNSIYLNLAGREGRGCVQANERDQLISKLRSELLNWRGPDGSRVISQIWQQAEAFNGPFAAFGPDVVMGFSPSYRASAETGLGTWKDTCVEPNQDHWGADHCIDVSAVPGVLFSNQGLKDLPHPSYRDIPALTIGVVPEQNNDVPPPARGDEDNEIVEERLRSLGYL